MKESCCNPHCLNLITTSALSDEICGACGHHIYTEDDDTTFNPETDRRRDAAELSEPSDNVAELPKAAIHLHARHV